MAAPAKRRRRRPPTGRPPLAEPSVRVQVTLYLHPGADDELIAWFAGLPTGRRALALKAALLAGGLRLADLPAGGPDDDDLTGDLLAGGLVF